MNATKKTLHQFSIIIVGQALSLIGSALVKFALIWYLTEQTGSAIVLTTATMVTFIPPLLLNPIAGALVDRWDRRTVMIVADSIIAAATLGVALLFALNIDAIWQIYLLMLVRATAGVFHNLATVASTSMMVPPEQLGRIQGLFQTSQGIATVAGPPLGALLVVLLPMQGVLAIDAATAAFAILPLLFIAIPTPEQDEAAEAAFKLNPVKVIFGDINSGLKLLRGWPAMLNFVLIVMVINLFAGPTSALLPILVTEHFNGDAAQFALMSSMWGLGFILGGVILSVWGGFTNRMLTVMLALVGMGVFQALLGFMPPTAYIGGVVFILLTALTLPMINGSAMAVMQATVPPEAQARVFSLLGSISMLAIPLGLLISGPVSEWIGVQNWYVIEGAAIIILAVVGFATPRVMRLETAPAPSM